MPPLLYCICVSDPAANAFAALLLPVTRQRLVGDCRLDKLPGMATDLETLIKVKHSTITDQNPLWVESW